MRSPSPIDHGGLLYQKAAHGWDGGPPLPDVMDTAAAVARVREEEGLRPPGQRLFEDPFARLFRGDADAEEVTARFFTVPFFREGIRLRTRFIDDVVRDALGAGLRQVVLLGAGLHRPPPP